MIEFNTLIDQIYKNVTPQNMHGDAGVVRLPGVPGSKKKGQYSSALI